MLHIRRRSAPVTTFLYYLENNRSEAELAAEHGATAIFSGNTGDQLFYQACARFCAGDYIQRHGLGRRAFGVALDAARMDRLSVWRVLKDGIARGLLGRQWSMAAEAGLYSSLLTPEASKPCGAKSRFTHPLFRDAKSAIRAASCSTPSRCFSRRQLHNPLGRMADPELVAPLYSQPLIELALRIPAYTLTAGGWERGDRATRLSARHAARDRRCVRPKAGSKSTPGPFCCATSRLVRELLLDGLLVRQGILDRKKLKEVLSGNPTPSAAAATSRSTNASPPKPGRADGAVHSPAGGGMRPMPLWFIRFYRDCLAIRRLNRRRPICAGFSTKHSRARRVAWQTSPGVSQ